jgi:beta-lactamase superfamily II metal-dependent hydrolase
VTASRTNSHLPNPDTVKRIQTENAVLYHTGKTGAVTVTVRDSKAAVTTFLNEKEQP